MMQTPKTQVGSAQLERAARTAFANTVADFDHDDEIIVHIENDHLRLVYLNVRASRRFSTATMIQCRFEASVNEIWINSLQVCDALRRQGFGRELVEAVEATARAIGVFSIKVYPLTNAVGFWESLGYRPDSRIARVLCKDLSIDSHRDPCAT